MDSAALIRLLQLSDPALPIGGFAHSAGLETYVQEGLVHCTNTARAFVSNQLCWNLKFTDAYFVSLGYNAAMQNDLAGLLELDELCNAIKLPREMREASQKLGIRLVKIMQPLTLNDCSGAYLKAIQEKKANGHYCVAFGIYSAAMCIPKAAALTGFLYNAVAGMVTNCVKLVPLGQQQGQEILFSLHRAIEATANDCIEPDMDRLGLCCPGFDGASMRHENLYSRLYMS